jgi:uncharacterized membrane protein
MGITGIFTITVLIALQTAAFALCALLMFLSGFAAKNYKQYEPSMILDLFKLTMLSFVSFAFLVIAGDAVLSR